ncbi:MAG: hypothetical protein IPQ10_08850 [Saprospiraceae bacterium]|nr:hypothetical protein [Saprospiraceae bacterium]
MIKFYVFALGILSFSLLSAQGRFVEYDREKAYEIGGISVSGNKPVMKNIIAVSGLRIGKKVSLPGPEIPAAIKAVYRQKLFF